MRKVRKLELKGQSFGRLLVIGLSHRNKRGEVFWRCKCKCGKQMRVRANSLTGGGTISCGCARLEAVTIHGMSGTTTFKSWESMKGRCLNSSSLDYTRFGGRGIKICKRWRDSFANFLSDMGERPKGTSLDRIDVNGHYAPGNCKWSTPREQGRNRRNTRRIKWKGRSVPLIELAEKHGLRVEVLVARLGSGWPLQRALTQPLTEGRGKKAPSSSERKALK